MTRREVVYYQLNASALNIIENAMTPKYLAHIRSCKTAKGAWEKLGSLFTGNDSIQESKYEGVSNEADNFHMLESESAKEMCRRLVALSVLLSDLGDSAVDEKWLRRKFVKAGLPFEHNNMTSIKGRSDYRTMTAEDILSEIIAMNISKKCADDALARGQGATRKTLALKAR